MFDDNEYRKAMDAALTRFQAELKKVRTGRAHPDMLANIKVEAYGQFMPLNQVANVTAAGGTLLQVTPFDPSTIQAIAAAIRNDASLGLNPSDDGHVVRVPVPPLTEERRKQLVKQCKQEAETAKVSVRNARRDTIDKLKKEIKNGLSEDNEKDAEAEVQKLHDKYIKEIDSVFAEKEKEILTV